MRYEFPAKEQIDIVIYEDGKGILLAEIYRDDIVVGTIECGELLGELLRLEVKAESENDCEFARIVMPEHIKDNGVLSFTDSNRIMKWLLNNFDDEYITQMTNLNSINLRKYFELCENNNIKPDRKNFDLFLSAFEIENISCAPLYFGSNDESGLMGVCLANWLDMRASEEKFVGYLKESETIKKAYKYSECEYADVLYALAFHILNSGRALKKCEHCKKWFVPNKSDEKYCNHDIFYIDGECDGHPILNITSCKIEAAKNVRKKREKHDEVYKLEHRIAARLQRRTTAINIDESEKTARYERYYNFLNVKDGMKQKLKSEEISKAEFLEWLKKYGEEV